MTPRDFAKPDEADRYDELQKRVNAGRDANAEMRRLAQRWATRMKRAKEKQNGSR